jgi:hypothetical protein
LTFPHYNSAKLRGADSHRGNLIERGKYANPESDRMDSNRKESDRMSNSANLESDRMESDRM